MNTKEEIEKSKATVYNAVIVRILNKAINEVVFQFSVDRKEALEILFQGLKNRMFEMLLRQPLEKNTDVYDELSKM